MWSISLLRDAVVMSISDYGYNDFACVLVCICSTWCRRVQSAASKWIKLFIEEVILIWKQIGKTDIISRKKNSFKDGSRETTTKKIISLNIRWLTTIMNYLCSLECCSEIIKREAMMFMLVKETFLNYNS